jgi:hypothetical protein
MDFWRTLAHVLVVGCVVPLHGCYLLHGRDAPEERPARGSARVDGGGAGAPLDAGGAPPRLDAHVPDPSVEDPCDEAYRAGAGAVCRDWLECERPIAGIPCCYRGLQCEAGLLVESVTCDDDCAQGCGLVLEASDCAAYGCLWVVPAGCYDESDPDWVNGCIQTVGAWCSSDLDCDPSERCRAFAVDPCAGSDCDACFALETRCVAQ